jgi:hypothetical protein
MEAAAACWYRIRRLQARLFALYYASAVENTSASPR